MTSPLLNADQVAELLGVSKRYVWRLGRDGELPRVLVGKYVRYDPADVQAFIERRKQSGRRSAARLEQPRAPLGTLEPKSRSARRRF